MRSLLSLLVGFMVSNTATAQTFTDPNEGSHLTYDSILGSYDFSWWGQPNRTYFIQHSDDLSAWEYLPLIESGTDDVLSWGFTSTAGKFFLRLRFSDIRTSDPINADFDGDKVSNNDELLQGTDPLSAADTDANGLPDDWEKFYFGHIGVAPNATAPGGGMTNLQHFELGSNPNNPPPPPTIIAGTAIFDQSAATPLYPAINSFNAASNGGNLITNGDFSQPSLGGSDWKTYPGIDGWTAVFGSGSEGGLIELQQIWVNTTANAGQYCELDSHWPTDDHSGPSDHGIQQTVNLARGHYLLFFDYRGREPGADSFTVKVKNANATTGATVLLAAKNGAETTWQRASASFEVTGGNPNSTQLPVTLLFDIPDSEAKDSYGAFIDNVMLVLLEIRIPKLNPAGAETGDWVSAGGLNIAKWESAYEPQSHHAPIVKENFIGLDVDRFVVRIPCLTPAGGAPPVVKLSTVSSNGTVIDDATELEMKSDPADSALLISEPQILVSDDGDDVYALNGAGADNVKGDKTHKAGLYDKVRIALNIGGTTATADWPVPTPLQVKTVWVQAVIMRNKPASEGGLPVASEAFVRTDITRRVNERFAQANLLVFPEVNIKIMDPPPTVNMEQGLAWEISGHPEIIGNWTLNDAVDRTHTGNDIHIIYIDKYKDIGGFPSPVHGQALIHAGTHNKIDSAIICVNPNLYNNCLTAHELGHILGHNVDNMQLDHIDSWEGLSNLMASGNAGDTSQVVLWKRLWRWQVEEVRKNSHVH